MVIYAFYFSVQVGNIEFFCMNKESYNKAWLKPISDLNIIKSGSDEDTQQTCPSGTFFSNIIFEWYYFVYH